MEKLKRTAAVAALAMTLTVAPIPQAYAADRIDTLQVVVDVMLVVLVVQWFRIVFR